MSITLGFSFHVKLFRRIVSYRKWFTPAAPSARHVATND